MRRGRRARVTTLAAVAAGGALGAVSRFILAAAIVRWLGEDFPHATLAVNVFGCFAMGLLVGASAVAWSPSPELRAGVFIGLLGGFTTFSAFSLDVASLTGRSAWTEAGIYITASVVLSIGGLFVGVRAARWVLG